jgi:16S rRNA (uracil1498-N3)-methyltransferase
MRIPERSSRGRIALISIEHGCVMREVFALSLLLANTLSRNIRVAVFFCLQDWLELWVLSIRLHTDILLMIISLSTVNSMRTIRLYIDQSGFSRGETVKLSDEAAHYLTTVLRAKLEQPLEIFNGQGQSAKAHINAIQKRQVTILVEELLTEQPESSLSIHLGIGISKGDRLEWVLQKATELGVTEITPLWCERSQVKLDADRQEKKYRHWQQILISACEQSGRNTLPILHAPVVSQQWISLVQSEKKLVLDPIAAQSLDAAKKPASVALLIGPEGGLTELEIQTAQKNEFNGLQLGPRILRTETAPLAALSILQFVWGDMG